MKDFNGIYTPAEGLSGICPKPDQRGDHGKTFNGVDGMEKGTPGQVDEVTIVSVTGDSMSAESAASKIGTPRGSAGPKGL